MVGLSTPYIWISPKHSVGSVPHRRLIAKLQSYGMKDKFLNWISAFLSQRTQVVKANVEESGVGQVQSGIPQGSVLRPIWFVIYINDILEITKSDGLLFADDTKIFKHIMSREDALALQACIDVLEKWSNTWLLKFNPDKCHVLILGKFENIR